MVQVLGVTAGSRIVGFLWVGTWHVSTWCLGASNSGRGQSPGLPESGSHRRHDRSGSLRGDAARPAPPSEDDSCKRHGPLRTLDPRRHLTPGWSDARLALGVVDQQPLNWPRVRPSSIACTSASECAGHRWV